MDVVARRPIGATGLEVSPLCLGGNVFGWTLDRRGSFAVLDAYADAGGNFIDTADVYSYWVPGNRGGESEEILGAWLRQSGRRDGMVIATKVGSDVANGRKDLSPTYVTKAVEGSLRRLGLDSVDLLYAHYDDLDTPPESTLAALDGLVRKGTVRAIGASNYSAPRFEASLAASERLGFARYTVLQPKYNLVEREFERALEPLCRAHGIGVMPYLGLANGFLTGKYRRGQPLPDTPRAAEVAAAYGEDADAWATLDALSSVASKRRASPAQVALAWLIGRPTVTAAIASATSVAQVEELVRGTDIELDDDDRRLLVRPAGG